MTDHETPGLPLDNLADRHPGLTESLASAYHEAARVCLDRHHAPPKEFRLTNDGEEATAEIRWQATDERIKRAWANTDDATRDGAYAVAIASAEFCRNLVTVSRAETKSGADYYVAPVGTDLEDMEEWYRLEVSGTDLDEQQVGYRVTAKVNQARQGNSNLPALAAVVGFKASLISLQTVK